MVCVSHGIDELFIKQLVGQLKGFAEYGFPESHSASFAHIAYASCFLKCHYPAAFCTALLNSQPMGFYSPNALLRDAMRHGVKVLPVCVNRSDWDAKLEPFKRGDKEEYAIRLGLRMVKGIKEQSVNTLLSNRQKIGLWQTLDDFLLHCKLRRSDLTSLAGC